MTRSRRIRLIAALAALALAVAVGACAVLDLFSGSLGSGLQPRTTETTEPLTELDAESPEDVEAPAVAESPIIASDAIALPRAKAEYTVLVYMVGSDLESSHGCASADLQEMLDAQLDAARVNLVVYTGGSQSWRTNIPNDRNCVIDIAAGKGAVAGATDRSLNMGAPETLSSFLTWACENYPAEHTALILWNHGGGPQGGYGYDQIYRNDHLTLAEMDQAMSEAGFGGDRRLDWVGFDACLMGSLEVMQTWQPYAAYLVGSQDEEPGAGWSYTFLETLNTTSDAREITTAIVDAYEQYFRALSNINTQPNVTLSAVDLSRIDAIGEALDDLSDVTLEDFETGRFSSIAQARSRCRSFGSTNITASTIGSPLVDLVDLAERIAARHPEQAEAIKQAVAATLVDNTTNLSGAHGISLYFPIASASEDVTAPSESYGRMLSGYSAQGQEADQVDWSFPELTLADETYTATLGDSQTRSLASASYTILRDHRGQGYVPIVSNVHIEPNEDGSLQVPLDPLVIVSASDGESLIRLTQTDGSAERQVYQSVATYLLPGSEFVDTVSGVDQVNLSLALDPKTEEVSVAAASMTDNSTPSASRSSIELGHYKSLMLYLGSWQYPDRADDGSMLPYSSWGTLSGNMIWYETPLDDELSFQAKHVSEIDETFVMQVILTDINGKSHASELIPLAAMEAQSARVSTENGTLTFHVASDHAELVSYKGSDTRVDVPAEVEGKPVTAVASNALSSDWTIEELTLPDSVKTIGSGSLVCHQLKRLSLGSGVEHIGTGALANCYKLAELELPEGLKSIGRGALRRVGVERLKLPASLEKLGIGALAGCENLTTYEVASGCKAATARDGVLFSADGTTLIAFPAARTGSYEAPTGTTAIGYGAFVSNKLSAVVLPEGLTSIDNCAFYCSGIGEQPTLTSIKLPDSLESVGAFAFGMPYRLSNFEQRPHFDELRLGSKLSYVGSNAFSGLNLSAFVVDERNPYYASPGGLLTNKTGDTVLQAPSGLGQVITIPAGVTTLGKEVFALCPSGADFILPASVSRISVLAFPFHYDGSAGSSDTDRVYDVTFHCDEGTAAAQFADKYHVSWDTTTDPASLSATRVEVEQGDHTLSFLVYPDRATLHAISGDGSPEVDLVIPDEVEGVPVTRIGSLATSEIYLDAWKSVTLPASLEAIDFEAIPLLRSYEGFSLAEQNATFSVRDGVLFSADGTALVAFSIAKPADAGEEPFAYEVPKGTRTIERGAFLNSRLEAVGLPSTLRVIRERAFMSNHSLTDIQIAKGLERIEESAFLCPATHIELPSSLTYLGDNALMLQGLDGLVLPEKLKRIGAYVFSSTDPLSTGSDTLHIGSKLTAVGQGTLATLDVTAFEVDEKNKYFASIDGLLTTKNGRDLLCCPSGMTGELHIPDGIRHLMPGCLDKAVGITDVYFPSSVIGLDPFYSISDAVARKVVFHCKAGSAAAQYAKEHDIIWTEEGIA